MDEDDPGEYCLRLQQVDAQQFWIKQRIVDLEGELNSLEFNCCISQAKIKLKVNSSSDVHVDKYNDTLYDQNEPTIIDRQVNFSADVCINKYTDTLCDQNEPTIIDK